MSKDFELNEISQLPSQPLTMPMPFTRVSNSRNSPRNSEERAVGSINSMPPHWHNEFPDAPLYLQPLLKLLFGFLCWAVFGRFNLDRQWKLITGNEDEFRRDQNRLRDILNGWLVTAGLLLTSSAAFITTPPPTGFLDYTQRGTYFCLWLSFGLMLGGVIIGSLTVLVISSSSQDHYRYTVMSTRLHLFAFLVMRCYPLLSILAAATVNFVGLLIAAWTSPYHIVRAGGSVCLAIPLSLVICLYAFRENTNPAIGEVRPQRTVESALSA